MPDTILPALQAHRPGVVLRALAALGLSTTAPRLRSWHSLEGMRYGNLTGQRLYSEAEMTAIAAIARLSEHGLDAGWLIANMPALDLIEPATHQAAKALPYPDRKANRPDRADAPRGPFLVLLREHGQLNIDVGPLSSFDLEDAHRNGMPVTMLDLGGLALAIRSALISDPQWRAMMDRLTAEDLP